MQNNDNRPDSFDKSMEDNTISNTPLHRPVDDDDSPTEPVHTTAVKHDTPAEAIPTTTGTQSDPSTIATTPTSATMTPPHYNNTHPTDSVPPALPFRGSPTRHSLFSRTSWFWPVAILMLLIVAGLALLAVINNHGAESDHQTISRGTPAQRDSSDAQHSFHVGDHAVIIIKGHSSNVSVHSGNAGTVLVQAKTPGSRYGQTLNGTRILYDESHPDPSADRVTIGADPIFNNIDYDLTVPTTASVQVQVSSGSVAVDGISGVTISTGSGSLDVEDVHGPVNISTDSGDITAQSIKGTMTLTAGSGSIRGSNLDGSLKATTRSGDLVIHTSALSGRSTLQTNSGSVRVDGSLDPRGTYHLTTYSGDVDLSLPADSAFQLQTTLGSGNLHNDFSRVDTMPQAAIIINIGSGSATINKLP